MNSRIVDIPLQRYIRLIQVLQVLLVAFHVSFSVSLVDNPGLT
jgi:hypothetical protein